jgi:hypothetical protein
MTGIKRKLMPLPSTLAAKISPKAWRHFATSANRNTEAQELSAQMRVVISVR